MTDTYNIKEVLPDGFLLEREKTLEELEGLPSDHGMIETAQMKTNKKRHYYDH